MHTSVQTPERRLSVQDSEKLLELRAGLYIFDLPPGGDPGVCVAVLRVVQYPIFAQPGGGGR